jgi:hypothetical protein
VCECECVSVTSNTRHVSSTTGIHSFTTHQHAQTKLKSVKGNTSHTSTRHSIPRVNPGSEHEQPPRQRSSSSWGRRGWGGGCGGSKGGGTAAIHVPSTSRVSCCNLNIGFLELLKRDTPRRARHCANDLFTFTSN